MGGRRAVVDVEDGNRDADGDSDEDVGEDEVATQEGDSQRRRGNDLHQQEEEDAERHDDRDAEGDLLVRLTREVEDEEGKS